MPGWPGPCLGVENTMLSRLLVSGLALTVLVACDANNEVCDDYRQRRKLCRGEEKRFSAMEAPPPSMRAPKLSSETPMDRCREGDEPTRAQYRKCLTATGCNDFLVCVYGRAPTKHEEWLSTRVGTHTIVTIKTDRIEVGGAYVLELEKGLIPRTNQGLFGLRDPINDDLERDLKQAKEHRDRISAATGREGAPRLAIVVEKDTPQPTIDEVRLAAAAAGFVADEPHVR